MCGALQKRTFIQHDIAKLTHGMPNIYQRKRKGEGDISLAVYLTAGGNKLTEQ